MNSETLRVEALTTDFTRLLVLVRDELQATDPERLERISAASDRLADDIAALGVDAVDQNRRDAISKIAATYEEFGSGLDRLFGARDGLQRLVSTEMQPAVDSATEFMGRVVYLAAIDGDLDASNNVSRALQDTLLSQIAFTRFLAGDAHEANTARGFSR